METLALRLLLPPLIITLASLAQSRVGDRRGGVLVGLPLTSGTFLVLLHLTDGPTTVGAAAVGMLGGQVAVVVMAAAYAWLAARATMPVALPLTLLVWAVAVSALGTVSTVSALCGLFGVVATAVLRRWPAAVPDPVPDAGAPPALLPRVVLTSGLVLTLMAATPLLGAHLAGLLAAAPLVALVIAPSTHRARGAVATRALLRGVVTGSSGAAAFALVVILLAEPLGGSVFVPATLAALAPAVLAGRVRPTVAA
ncbi:MAG: hypothetical protein C0493_11645 [Kytococcus sp.]|nr:hypothetical protein [Kytococcus sp.]